MDARPSGRVLPGTPPDQFVDPVEDVHVSEDGLVIHNSQWLTPAFWDELKEVKDNFAFRLNGLTPVAQVPAAIWAKWKREGFDADHAPAKEIIRKLRLDGYETFIVSGDKTF